MWTRILLIFICSSQVFPTCLPRFVSLKYSTTNLHVGPGLQYSADWILTLKHMPVLVFSEYGQWRQVKLCDGTAGWLHKSVLSGKKTAMLRCEAILWNEPSESSRRVAQLGQHVVVSVIKKKKKWTKVVVTAADGDKFTGWLQTKDLWGWGQSG